MDLQKKNAFTLAEMMIVLLVISLTMAAFLPVMTKRNRNNPGAVNPWEWGGTSRNDAVFRGRNTDGAIIGANEFAGGENARMLINTATGDQHDIIFKSANVRTGFLDVLASRNIGLGDITFDAATPTVTGVTLIGSGALVTAPASGSTVIGEDANSNGLRGVAIGAGANSSGPSAIAIGAWGNNFGTDSDTLASGANSISIGRTSQATNSNAIAIGNQALSSGIGSIAIGYGTTAGSETTASAENAIAMGLNAKATIESGIAIGYGAKANKDGNIAIGKFALVNNSTSADVTQAIENTAVGALALAANVNGRRNTALGYGALNVNQNASGSVAVGARALANASGDTNIGVGYKAGGRITTGEGNIAIGYGALRNSAVDENPMDYINTAVPHNNIAIGTGACGNVTGSNKVCIGADSGPAAGHSYATDSAERIFIGRRSYRSYWTDNGDPQQFVMPTNNGIVEIHNNASASSTDSALVVVNASLLVRGGLFIADDWDGKDERMIRDDESWVDYKAKATPNDKRAGSPSDRRLKNVGADFISGLDKIRDLKTYHYTFKKDKKKTPRIGVMAQDLQKVFPDAVMKGRDGFLRIRTEDMFYAMVNSIKELDVIVQGLVKDVKSIVARVQTIDDKILALIKVDQMNVKKIKELQYKNALLEKQNKNFEARLRKLEQK